MKKSAWNRFSERIAKRLEKHKAQFQKIMRRYEQEKDPERKLELKIEYLEKFAPTFTVAFFEELASTSERAFGKMMSEIHKAMKGPLEEISRGYLDFELMTRDPITVLEEIFLTERVWRVARRELEKHQELFDNPELLLRWIEIMAIREFSFGVIFMKLRPFFAVLKTAEKRLGIDENWAIASFALNLEESLVKKKLSELGVSKDEMGKDFHKLVERLKNLIETKEGRRLPSDLFLIAGYRKLRNKLVHEGYLWKPNRKETHEIVSHSLKLADALWANES